MSTYEEIANMKLTLWNQFFPHWLSVEIFSSSWFIIVLSMLLLYAVLIMFIDKSRLREMIFYGSLLAVSFGYIDTIGTTMGLWIYKTNILPFTPSLFPFAYTLHPIVHLLVYQNTSTWRSFILVNTLATALFAFIAQPFFAWAQVLQLIRWSYLYSFVLAWGVTLFARGVIVWLANIEQSHSTETRRTILSPKLQPAMKILDEKDKKK